jgi:hypothetical protein
MTQAANPMDAVAALQFVKEARARFNAGLNADKDNRDMALEDLRFRSGRQWSALDEARRKADGRPILTINRMSQFVKQVTGELRRSKIALGCTPGDGDADPATAEVMAGLIRAIERTSGAGRIYARAGDQVTSCGMGHMRLRLVWADERSFDREIAIEAIRNPFSVVWDERAVKDDRSDARWCFVTDEVDPAEFKSRWPNATPSGWDAPLPSAEQAMPVSHSPSKAITICEYWLVKETPTQLVRLFDPNQGEIVTEIEGDPAAIREEAQARGIEVVELRTVQRRTVCSYLLSGSEVLEGPIEWPGLRIPIFTAVGEEVDLGPETYRHGLLRFAKDPQRMLNFAASSDAEAYGLAPKAPFILAASQIKGFEDQWADINKGSVPYAVYNDSLPQLGKPSREPPPGTNPALLAMAQQASQYLKDTTGIYDASLGARSNESSGVAIEARDAQADTGTYVYIDNLLAAVEAMGREIVAVIPAVYSGRRQIRILGEDDAPAIVALERGGIVLDRGKYDVIVKTGPAYATQRERSAELLKDLVQKLPPQLATPVVLRIIAMSEVRDAEGLAQELRAIAEQTGLLPPPMAPPGAGPPMGPEGMPPRPPEGPGFRSLPPEVMQ